MGDYKGIEIIATGSSVTNQDVIQSYLITSAKYNFNPYEKRLMYAIVQAIQRGIQENYPISNKKLKIKDISSKITNGIDVSQSLITIERENYGEGNFNVKMHVSTFLRNEKDQNYQLAKMALMNFEGKKFYYDTPEKWKLIRLISEPVIDKEPGFVYFRLHEEIFNALLDFSKGFQVFELKTAMNLRSIYSMRFYELVSNQNVPLTYTIARLKDIFNLEDKYDKYYDFKLNVIEKARKELLKVKSPWAFRYTENKKGRAVNSITIHPLFFPEFRDEELEEKRVNRKISNHWHIEQEILYVLKEKFGFTKQEITNNRKMLETAQRLSSKGFFLLDFLSEQFEILQVDKLDSVKNVKGWIINSIKKQIEQNR